MFTGILSAALAVAFAAPAKAPQPTTRPARPRPQAFFALCMDTHDAKKRGLAQQARMLKELGYDGAGHLWLGKLPERLKTLDDEGLKLFQVYLRVNIAAKGPGYDAKLKTLLPLLTGRGTALALLMNGRKPSDPAGDARAVAIVTEIAEMARPNGVKVVLYPHSGAWLERVEDAVRIAKAVGRPDVGVMFNLCHWLKVDDEKNLPRVLALAKPHLLAVSLHGADTAESIHAGKGKWIQPLDSGTFDVLGLLKALRHIGYTAPIGLQCYGLRGDARDHLARSMTAWRKLNQRLADE